MIAATDEIEEEPKQCSARGNGWSGMELVAPQVAGRTLASGLASSSGHCGGCPEYFGSGIFQLGLCRSGSILSSVRPSFVQGRQKR